jgi:hypothetical protein
MSGPSRPGSGALADRADERLRLGRNAGNAQDLARQVARFGVTLNIVTLTPAPLDAIHFPRFTAATVTEVAGLVEMLCHDEAGFMTAQSFSLVSAAS